MTALWSFQHLQQQSTLLQEMQMICALSHFLFFVSVTIGKE